VATLTYAYADSTAVVGPLATYSEPHSYDLCEEHALRLTVPRGWEVVRHDGEFAAPEPSVDDLTALAEAAGHAPLDTRQEQADVVLIAAAVAGLAMLARSGRLTALGFDEQELLARLEARFAKAT